MMSLLHNANSGSLKWSERCSRRISTCAQVYCRNQRSGLFQAQQQLLVCRAAASRQSRWMKVVEAEEYQYYYGYTGNTTASTAAAAAAASQSGATAVLPSAASDHLLQQQLSQDIRLAGDWTDLLQIATEHQHNLTATLWHRLLFRLFVLLVEVEWAAADLVALLTDTLPPLLSAAAASLEAAAAIADQQQQQQQQQDQQTFVGQLADMLYSLAVLAGRSCEASFGLVPSSTISNGGADSSSSSSSSSSGGSGSIPACWYQGAGMQHLLDAVAVTGTNWDMEYVSRKDAVSLLWAYGKLLQSQQMHNATPAHSGVGRSSSSSSSSDSSNGSSRPNSASAADSLHLRQKFVSQLCSHITLLIQLSNNTADSAAAQNPGTRLSNFQNPSQHPNISALTEPWHPDDLIDAVTGLAAAAGAPRNQASLRLQHQRPTAAAAAAAAAAGTGFKGLAAASLLDAAAHEVYRQVSNRHSTAGSFTVEGVVDLLQAYCSLDYKDGPSLRMFDAAAGWVVKRVRSRHMQAPGSPSQLAAVAGVFAALRHRSVVVPELLNALNSQACKAAAAAVELAAEDPWSYHTSDSSSYCHWQPTHAATFLQSHIQLGYRPSDTVINAILTALMLHWEFEQAQQDDRQAKATAGEFQQLQRQQLQHQQGIHLSLPQQHKVEPQQQQKQMHEHGHQQQQESASGQRQDVAGDDHRHRHHQQQQQQQHLQDVVQVLDVLAQLGHQPGQRVLNTLLRQAWQSNPLHHLSKKCLVTLLFSTAQLAAAPPVKAALTTVPRAAVATASQAAAAAAGGTSTAAITDSSADVTEAVTVVSDGRRQIAAAAEAAATAAMDAAAAPDQTVLSAIIDHLILSTMPEHEQQQQGDSLTVEELIRVLWSCCVFGSLDIAQFGWLLVAVAGSSWQRLGQEQLLVIKQGELLLGQDGADMASEVLPAQLLRRVEAAWATQQ